jgi:pimeloyl-ACP methyl ester carboxylesterase
LIHGVGHRWQAWLPILDRLVSEGFQTIAIDAPGFGASPPLAGKQTPTIQALSTAVARFLDQMGLERAHLAGNSMGGAIAIELARAGRASTVTAISPAGLWTSRERLFCQVSLRATFNLIRALPRPIAGLCSSSPGRTVLASQLMARPWRVPADELRADIDGMAHSPGFLSTLNAFESYVMGDFHELEGAPITIAWGTHDLLLITRQARRARRLMPRASHVWLAGGGHIPMWDDPRLVASVIVKSARAGT